MSRIDLHIHSNLSDGDDSIFELIRKIKNENIDLFAITDHDNVKSIEILKTITNIRYIPGVEMSSYLNKVKMHILGYGINDIGKIRCMCDAINIKRKNLVLEIIDDLKKRGYHFENEYLNRFDREDLILSKVDISKLLVKAGYAKDVSEAFHGILKPYKIGSQIRQDAKQVIEGIKTDNGISILAHPGEIIKKQNVNLLRLIDELIEIGINGIEVYTPKHTIEEETELLKVVQNKNLLITGGSDYHGNFTKPGINLCDRVKENMISEKVKQKSIKH